MPGARVQTRIHPDESALSTDRRSAIKLLATGIATVASGCSRPTKEIVPYVEMPERLVPGLPLYFASATSLAGFAQPVVVETHEGRPTKVEGNPSCASSGGATDAYAQAQIFDLYDPYRLRAMQHRGEPSTWDDFLDALTLETAHWRSTKGQGLRLLTGRVTSPSLRALIRDWTQIYPLARWHVWEASGVGDSQTAAFLTFGRRLDVRWSFERKRVIVALDHDFLGPGPDQTRFAREFSGGRRARSDTAHLTQLFAAGPSLSLTCANADVVLSLPRRRVANLVLTIAAAFGAPIEAPPLDNKQRAFAEAAIAALRTAGGESLVCIGQSQPPAVQAAAYWINHAIGAVGHGLDFIAPVDSDDLQFNPLDELVHEMASGAVNALFMIGVNPIYDAPGDLNFSQALSKVPFSVCSSLDLSETAELSRWAIPAPHIFEAWSDLTDSTGAVTLVQPMIEPLYECRSSSELLRASMELPQAHDYDLLRGFWRKRQEGADFETWWRRALHDGIIPPGPAPRIDVGIPVWPSAAASDAGTGIEITFDPDPSVFDGRFAQNPWLQELPQPISRQVWGNAAEISAYEAKLLGLTNGDILRVSIGESLIDVPARISDGRAKGSVGLRLGGGRRTGAIGANVGVDVNPLRRFSNLWVDGDVKLARQDDHADLLFIQTEDRTFGEDIVRTLTLAELQKGVAFASKIPETTYPEDPLPSDGYAWSMVIDLTACIGCNACIVACQSENNIPVVGPEEVARGREMHWLRVDTYATNRSGADIVFQPTPCMQCEKAPCEPVCPVEASVHDSEGLNVQVYNRCIGTRFCQSNCPYKVRRFNFFGYGDGQEYKGLGAPPLSASHNPDVSVRARGVMEKCTYCVQRISHARRDAEKERRFVRDGEARTACQQVCPTQAISFGNGLDDKSAVAHLKKQPHNYAMLEELGTRPRTTYLARVRDVDGTETER